MEVASEIVVLAQGNAQQVGTPQEVYESFYSRAPREPLPIPESASTTPRQAIRALSTSLGKTAPQVGLEPTTNRLTAGRSTTELLRHNFILLETDKVSNLFGDSNSIPSIFCAHAAAQAKLTSLRRLALPLLTKGRQHQPYPLLTLTRSAGQQCVG